MLVRHLIEKADSIIDFIHYINFMENQIFNKLFELFTSKVVLSQAHFFTFFKGYVNSSAYFHLLPLDLNYQIKIISVFLV